LYRHLYRFILWFVTSYHKCLLLKDAIRSSNVKLLYDVSVKVFHQILSHVWRMTIRLHSKVSQHTHLMLAKVKQFSKTVIELWTEITDLNLLLHSWKKYERSSRISHASLQFIFNISRFENCYFNHLFYIIHYRSKVSARLMFLLTILFLLYKNYDIIYFSEIFNKVAN